MYQNHAKTVAYIVYTKSNSVSEYKYSVHCKNRVSGISSQNDRDYMSKTIPTYRINTYADKF